MEDIDKLTMVSKSLYNHRIVEQRQQIETLKKNDINSYYLVCLLDEGSNTVSVTIIRGKSDADILLQLSKMKRFTDMFNDINEDLISDNEKPFLDVLEYVRSIYDNRELAIYPLTDLIGRWLDIDPGYLGYRLTSK